MNENNISKEKMEEIVESQRQSYQDALEDLMSNKDYFIENIKLYESEIFSLKKIISINKRAGNTYAVLRDEVQLNSYLLLSNQNRLIKEVLLALDYSTRENLDKEITKLVVMNQKENQAILSKDYSKILELDSSSALIEKVKENIQEFYFLQDINQDVINHIYLLEDRMFRLNKYSKYNLIGIVLYINNIDFVKQTNHFLSSTGLDVVKLLIITFLSIFMYIFRVLLFISIEKYILKISNIKAYVSEIIGGIRTPLNYVLIIININIIVYIYSNFGNTQTASKFFNIIYAFFITFIIYKVLNVIASAKIHEFNGKNKKIKNEVINVGIKIVNFLIMVTGLLVILHLAGANLTTILSGLGIGGFAVALAAKDSLANFFGTLSIMLSDVYSQGDWIVVNGQEGVVVELGLRVTTLRTFDNALVAIPNTIMANEDVKNWNKRELGRRIKMSLGVRYDSKSEDIKNAVNEIREMLDKHPQIATQNTKYDYNPQRYAKLVSRDDSHGVKKLLLVYLDEFSDSSINILVYCFTKSVKWEEWLSTKEDVMHKIMEIFEKNNLEFAFPSLSVYPEKEA